MHPFDLGSVVQPQRRERTASMATIKKPFLHTGVVAMLTALGDWGLSRTVQRGKSTVRVGPKGNIRAQRAARE